MFIMTIPAGLIKLLQFTKENMTILLQFVFESFTMYRDSQRIQEHALIG